VSSLCVNGERFEDANRRQGDLEGDSPIGFGEIARNLSVFGEEMVMAKQSIERESCGDAKHREKSASELSKTQKRL